MEERNMSGLHEPREEFVNQLERRVRADLKRRDLVAETRTWMPRSRLAVAVGIAAVVLVSMAVGGGAVAAAYASRLSEQRDLLLASFEQRLAIAEKRLALAAEQLKTAQQRVSVGIEPRESVAEAQARLTESEAQVKALELDIEEIRHTGREPMNGLSAPLVSDRDFVTERLRVEMTVPVAAIQLEKARVQAARTRFDVGLANSTQVVAAGTRLIELESAVEVLQRKIGIRQAFLKGGLPPAAADLRALEAETEMRRTTLARRIDFARKQLQDLKARIQVGTLDPVNLAEAELHLQELQLALTKADYDLVLIRQQLGK
jgi:outer membrane protein TolC